MKITTPKKKAVANGYVARPGSPITNAQAKVIGHELEVMEAQGLRKSPKALLDRAREEDSPLHRLFDWDDASAAEKHRVEWARELIASVMVIDVKTERHVRAYHSVSVEMDDGAGRSYESRGRVLADSDALTEVAWGIFQRLRAGVVEAQGLGLDKKSRFWADLCGLVLTREPEVRPAKAAKELQTA